MRCWWKKLKMTQTDAKIYHVLLLEESVLSKMTILLKALYRFSEIPVKSPMAFFTKLEQTILFMEAQKTKQSWKRKTAGRVRLTLDHTTMLPSSKQCGTAQNQKYRSMEHHAKSRNKPTHLWSINLGGKKTIHWRKDILSNKWCQKNWTETHKKWN